MVIARLRQHGLVVNPDKCSFDVTEIDFLGHIVSPNGVSMDPVKSNAVTSWQVPKSIKDVKVFLGFANYYRRYIRDFATLTHPLTILLRKNFPFCWNQHAQASFDLLKHTFSSALLLRHHDFSKTAVLETDASDYAIGAVLSQYDAHGMLQPWAFISRKMNPAEINYDIHDKELLAIVELLHAWRHYVVSVPADEPLTILSDHKNLARFSSKLSLSRRQFQ
jgi:hypothetical protein